MKRIQKDIGITLKFIKIKYEGATHIPVKEPREEYLVIKATNNQIIMNN